LPSGRTVLIGRDVTKTDNGTTTYKKTDTGRRPYKGPTDREADARGSRTSRLLAQVLYVLQGLGRGITVERVLTRGVAVHGEKVEPARTEKTFNPSGRKGQSASCMTAHLRPSRSRIRIPDTVGMLPTSPSRSPPSPSDARGHEGGRPDSPLRAGPGTRSADARELVARQQDQGSGDPESRPGGDPRGAPLHGADHRGVRSLFS
jgi:hypothetical protein